jgi:4a-hydroxytetrahydrobiopterin dehydratase
MDEQAKLYAKKCLPCEGGVAVLTEEKARELLEQVPGWKLFGNKSVSRRFEFGSYRQAQAWLNRVADLAEQEGHHPDVTWNYRKVLVELSTHAIGGLSENDFILAAKIDKLSADG